MVPEVAAVFGRPIDDSRLLFRADVQRIIFPARYLSKHSAANILIYNAPQMRKCGCAGYPCTCLADVQTIENIIRRRIPNGHREYRGVI